MKCCIAFKNSSSSGRVYNNIPYLLNRPLLRTGCRVKVLQRTCHLLLSWASSLALARTTPLHSILYLVLSSHFNVGLPVLLLLCGIISHSLLGYIWSSFLQMRLFHFNSDLSIVSVSGVFAYDEASYFISSCVIFQFRRNLIYIA